MIELTDDGFETLVIKRQNGADIVHEFDLFEIDSKMIGFAGDDPSEDEFFGRVAKLVTAMIGAPDVRISQAKAQEFYAKVRERVAGIKKNAPYLTSADSPKPTASPSGSMPAGGSPPA